MGFLKWPQEVQARLEARSEQQGKEVADAIIRSTQEGRGLWIFLQIPAAIVAAGFGPSILGAALHTNLPFPFFLLLAAASGIAWWNWSFAKKHPILAIILLVVGIPAALEVASKL